MPHTPEQRKLYMQRPEVKKRHLAQVKRAYWKKSVKRRRAENKARYARHREMNQLRTLRNNYGLSIEDLEKMYVEQNAICAICQERQTYKRLAIDHDHVTGKLRGLLCERCNFGLGQFRDSPAILRAAIDYLNRYGVSKS